MSALALPDPFKYTVQVRIGDNEWETDDKKTTVFEEGGKIISNYNRYQQNLHEVQASNFSKNLCYLSVADMGAVFIYLIRETAIKKKKERVCFLRLNAKDFEELDAPLKWYEMEPDLAIGTVKD